MSIKKAIKGGIAAALVMGGLMIAPTQAQAAPPGCTGTESHVTCAYAVGKPVLRTSVVIRTLTRRNFEWNVGSCSAFIGKDSTSTQRVGSAGKRQLFWAAEKTVPGRQTFSIDPYVYGPKYSFDHSVVYCRAAYYYFAVPTRYVEYRLGRKVFDQRGTTTVPYAIAALSVKYGG